ncbi:MAG: CopG family transcriptional regulator [Gammaproteobacteria bacterium]
MGQVTIYLDEQSEKHMRRAAKAAGLSVSRWLAERVQDEFREEWPPAVRDAAGAWPDFPDVEELRAELREDARRETL